MSKIIKKASVGKEKQNADCVITIEPYTKGIKLEFSSLVGTQYGDDMKKTIMEELEKYGIKAAKVTVVDRGAIDCVLRARLEAVIKRAMEA